MKVRFHPACLLFPQLPKDELLELAESIKQLGLLEPIVLYKGMILDGRNRYLACKIAKVKPRFIEWKGKGSPLAWVISENLIRRHLTSGQRAVIALDVLPLLEKEAKERQRLSKGRGKKVRKNLRTFSENGESRQIAARLMHTNSAYVQVVKTINAQAPELLDKIRAGSLSVPDAKRLSEIPEEERKRLLQRANGQGCDGEMFRRWKTFSTPKAPRPVNRSANERKNRIEAVTLIRGDCRAELKKLPSKSVDAIVCDPPYPEVHSRGESYPRILETDWHLMMQEVVVECRRLLKPTGSSVFILQPNAEKIGRMRLWLWRFVTWAGETWNLVEDAYWWNYSAIPKRGSQREVGLLRPSVKWCVWLGSPDCYRNQDNVLWTPSDTLAAKRREVAARIISPSGTSYRNSTLTVAAEERGGTVPFNLLPLSASGQPENGGHPAVTPYSLAKWWCRYILPQGGVLLDPFCGSGTMLLAGLDHGAAKVIGIEKEKRYVQVAKRRLRNG